MTSEKKLKRGFTTGTAAAAAANAALSYLLTEERKKNVTIRFLTGEITLIPIDQIKKISHNKAESIVIKDAGDDPDVTHKAEIGARVTVFPENDQAGDNHDTQIIIKGGPGVGVVTKPGLEVACGHSAINPGPRKMIIESVNNVLDSLQESRKIRVEVEVFVPKGEELAKKTLNFRLGIKGGISILGTTGIVKPMSHEAYIATIKYGISVAKAMGSETLVFTTGRRSERFAMQLFPDFREDVFIQIGDFFQASLDEAESAESINSVIITVFFGKAVKMAMGFPHTHAAKSELTMKKLAQWAENITKDKELVKNILQSNSARHAFTYINPDYPDIISCVGKKIVKSAGIFSHSKLKIRAIIFDFNGNVVFDSLNRDYS